MDAGATPVTRVTLRFGAQADSARLRALAELDTARVPIGPVLVAEVDGRLRAALPLDGSAGISDPFHRGDELLELLRLRAKQLGARAKEGSGFRYRLATAAGARGDTGSRKPAARARRLPAFDSRWSASR
jgi:hypothetical protein